MPERQEVLHSVANRILALPSVQTVRVGIDGVDGAGKTMFGDELVHILAAAGRPIIRASVDSFHNPRATRYRLGQPSPEGYFLDSYDYDQLKAVLLDPISPGGTGRYRTAVFDHRQDAPVRVPEAQAAPHAILVFDGIFLHRPELRAHWDFFVFLQVRFDVSILRMAQRDGSSPDPHAATNHRYVAGQQIYLRTCTPQRHATITINNDDLAFPSVVS